MYAFKLPESPRWLAAKGMHAEALSVLAALDNTSVDDPKVLRTWHGICDAVATESEGGFAFGELLQGGKRQNFRRTMLGILGKSLKPHESPQCSRC